MKLQNDLSGARVVAVHAHPDDEAITTGGILADLASRGADVTVITCTLGEQGEVIGDTYQGLVAADQLGGFRIHELNASLDILGVRGIFLGGAGRWRDSGMVGDPANEHSRAFINSGDEAVEQLEVLLQQLQPHLLITYGPDGGYGHPDHIRAHEITHAAGEKMGVPRILWAVIDRIELQEGLDAITSIPSGWGRGDIAAVDQVDLSYPLSDVTYARKVEAMRAHATQLWIADGSISHTNPVAAISPAPFKVWALSNLIAQPIMRHEHFQLGFGMPLVDSVDPLGGVDFR